ncbi:MAG: amidohydrolase family protein, partial [Phenylobacterium sp.]
MEKAYDLVVRGGLLVDGTGGAPFEADVAVKDGRIAAVGRIAGSGAQEIDARGQLVTPGFVDIHTHYDGQATWDARMQPSSWHGVTTVVMGNCGVGFAPCKAADHDRLIRLMEGVEDIPFPVLAQGLPWNWESYPDYLDALSSRRFDIDVGSQLPHAALRVFVMGERGANREPATEADIHAMAAIARRAVEAGALGFSTSRTLNHRTSDGQPTPTLTASEDELTGIAMGLAAAGRGTLQFVSDFADPAEEWAMLRRIVERSGRPLSFSLLQSPRGPRGYRALLDRLAEATAAGLPMRAQVAGRPVGILFGLELTLNPFSQHAAYREIRDLPLAGKVAKLTDPAFRRRLLAEETTAARGFAGSQPRAWGNMFLMGEEPDYEPTADQTVEAIAARRGVTSAEVALDQMLSLDGRGMLYLPFLNYADMNLDPAYEMLTHPDCVPGLSDGGAHVGMICDGSFPTSNITHWTRDRTR